MGLPPMARVRAPPNMAKCANFAIRARALPKGRRGDHRQVRSFAQLLASSGVAPSMPFWGCRKLPRLPPVSWLPSLMDFASLVPSSWAELMAMLFPCPWLCDEKRKPDQPRHRRWTQKPRIISREAAIILLQAKPHEITSMNLNRADRLGAGHGEIAVLDASYYPPASMLRANTMRSQPMKIQTDATRTSK